jgi:hypothetical protein
MCVSKVNVCNCRVSATVMYLKTPTIISVFYRYYYTARCVPNQAVEATSGCLK